MKCCFCNAEIIGKINTWQTHDVVKGSSLQPCKDTIAVTPKVEFHVFKQFPFRLTAACQRFSNIPHQLWIEFYKFFFYCQFAFPSFPQNLKHEN